MRTRTVFNPRMRAFLRQRGNDPIIHMRVGRAPIRGMLSAIINKLAVRSHDQFFHLYIIIALNDGTVWRLEKNEQLELYQYKPNKYEELSTTIPIPSSQKITMNLLLSQAIAKFGVQRVFHYSALTTNCQRFIADLLDASNLLTDELRKFILQNVARLVPSWAEKLAQFVTDLAGRAKIAIEGEGTVIKDPHALPVVLGEPVMQRQRKRLVRRANRRGLRGARVLYNRA